MKNMQTIKSKTLISQLQNGLSKNIALECSVIEGVLDISDEVISKPIKLQNCIFLDKVIFANTEFTKTVEFKKCKFLNGLNCGDELHTHTIFHKDFILSKSIFKGNCTFIGIKCFGSANFNETLFISTNSIVNFSNSTFEKSFECEKSIFCGEVTFNSMSTNIGASYNQSIFKNKETDVDFIATSYSKALQCQGAIFYGGVAFNGINCELWTNFSPLLIASLDYDLFKEIIEVKSFHILRSNLKKQKLFLSNCFTIKVNNEDYSWILKDIKKNTRFNIIKDNNKVNIFQPTSFKSTTRVVQFDYSKLGCSFRMEGAIFENPIISIGNITCKDFHMYEAEFLNKEGRLFFNHSHVENKIDLNFIKVESREVDFSNLKCRDFYLPDSIFNNKEGTIDFRHSKIGWILNCNDIVFEGKPDFNGIECQGGGFFHNTEFRNENLVDFEFSQYGLNVQFDNTKFYGPVSLESIEIKELLRLNNTTINKEFSLKNAEVNRFILYANNNDKAAYDLRGFTFKNLESDYKQYIVNFACKQNTNNLCSDPFIQLERYLHTIGKSAEAEQVYYQGKKNARKWALTKGTNINWSTTRIISDWFLKVISGYGTKNHRLILLIFLFITLGVIIFWDTNSIVPIRANNQNGILSNNNSKDFINKLIFKYLYSIDLFIPVINFNFSDNFQANTIFSEIYSFLHILSGWILTTLSIASFSGLIKKQ